MSAVAMVSFRHSALAWSDTADDERLFKRVTGWVLVSTLAVAGVLTLTQAPKALKEAPQPLPATMAKLLLEHQPPAIVPAKPIPVAPVKPAETDKAPSPKERVTQPAPEVARKETVVRDAPVVEAPPRAVSPAPAVVNEAAKQAAAVEAARKKVAGLGLLAAKEDMAQVRGGGTTAQLKTDIRQSGGGQVSAQPDGAALTRALITSNSSGGSQSVNVPVGPRSVQSAGLATRATTTVTDEASVRVAAAAAKRVAEAAASKPKRSSEDIRLVLSRNKGALDAIFNRAAREDPTLQGKVVFEIKIAPTGEVLSCKVAFSELHAPEVEAKLVARIRMIDFGAKEVDVTTDKVSYDFLPA